MGRPRSELQALLETFVPPGGKVYFQPPANVKIVYPCIVYKRDYADSQFAGNVVYSHTKRYQVTVIDKKAESSILPFLDSQPLCLFTRSFAVDDLNHDVYSLYF